MQMVLRRSHARGLSPPDWDDALRMGVLIVFPVVGLEQTVHTTPAALQGLPVYEALHWLSDSLLALPLAVASVGIGRWLGDRMGIGWRNPADLFARACFIAAAFAVVLVPGSAVHEQLDSLTHAHALLAIHSHGPPAAQVTDGPLAAAAFAAHALIDGIEGQVIGLPLLFGALWWSTRSSTRDERVVTRRRGI